MSDFGINQLERDDIERMRWVRNHPEHFAAIEAENAKSVNREHDIDPLELARNGSLHTVRAFKRDYIPLIVKVKSIMKTVGAIIAGIGLLTLRFPLTPEDLVWEAVKVAAIFVGGAIWWTGHGKGGAR